MENILKVESCNPNTSVDTHLDFKLDGWPASAVLITLCLSGVIIYGIKVWGEVHSTHSAFTIQTNRT